MADTFSTIQEAVNDFLPLHKRMDGDKDLYNMIGYKLQELEGLKDAKDVVNVTMNDPKIFADRAQAFMNEATMQTLVEGKHLKDADSTIIENFDSDIRYEIDQRLMVREITSLYSFLIEQATVRGTLAARYYTWEDEGKFTPDLLPIDSRYLVYEYGTKKLEWGAFKTIRSKAAIEQEYEGSHVPGKKAAIWEYWNKDEGQIWMSSPDDLQSVSGTMLGEPKENVFGEPPLIIQGVGAGSMLQDADSMEHRHESVFSSNRLLYPQLNMLASILQTLNYMSFNRVHMWESEAGITARKPPKPGSRKTIPIDKGTRGLFPVELTDIKNATRLFYALLLGAVQRGSLPNIDYGNLTFPLSAVAISRLTATKDAIFSPRLQAVAWFYRQLHYMIKDQYINGGYQAELGEEGLKREYSASDLDKKYAIKYRFFSVSPEQDIANYAVAQQALAVGLSKHTVYTDILKLRNPEGEIMKSRAEMAEKVDPIIALRRYGHGLIDQGEFFEAELVKERIKIILRQRYQPNTGAETEEELMARNNGGGRASPESMVPLLEGGGGRGGKVSPEFEADTTEPEDVLRSEERRTETVRKSEAEG